jgi:hypothetical protein
MFVTSAVFYLSTGLARCLVGLRISCSACKLVRISRLKKKKRKRRYVTASIDDRLRREGKKKKEGEGGANKGTELPYLYSPIESSQIPLPSPP